MVSRVERSNSSEVGETGRPQNGWPTSKDIVPWVRHLLTDGCWANGQTLLLNGGYTTR
jgi:hypothetical protein